MVLETAGLIATDLGGYCREQGLFPEQVDRWRHAAQDANAHPLLAMADQKDLQKRHQVDQQEIKLLQQELRRKEKALADRVKENSGLLGRGGGTDRSGRSPQGPGDP